MPLPAQTREHPPPCPPYPKLYTPHPIPFLRTLCPSAITHAPPRTDSRAPTSTMSAVSQTLYPPPHAIPFLRTLCPSAITHAPPRTDSRAPTSTMSTTGDMNMVIGALTYGHHIKPRPRVIEKPATTS